MFGGWRGRGRGGLGGGSPTSREGRRRSGPECDPEFSHRGTSRRPQRPGARPRGRVALAVGPARGTPPPVSRACMTGDTRREHTRTHALHYTNTHISFLRAAPATAPSSHHASVELLRSSFAAFEGRAYTHKASRPRSPGPQMNGFLDKRVPGGGPRHVYVYGTAYGTALHSTALCTRVLASWHRHRTGGRRGVSRTRDALAVARYIQRSLQSAHATPHLITSSAPHTHDPRRVRLFPRVVACPAG